MSNKITRLVEKEYSASEKLLAGDNVIPMSNPSPGDGDQIMGIVQCDQAVTLKFYWGFQGNYLVKETDIAVPASFAEGGGVKIGPYSPHGSKIKMVVSNAGAATPNFRIALYAHT